jgi:acyl carrier protein
MERFGIKFSALETDGLAKLGDLATVVAERSG